ncbi:hypothetical protein F5146DRAFT_1124496 [Armillaria mellea]|nr:hypothetical protein F5146DRAFT_1124496 [Armillaria mellea]
MPPSHYPLVHITPLPSADSSDVSLLDDYDSSKPQTRVSYGGRRRISVTVIIPGILIFITNAGLASALLVWLQSRRVESHVPHDDQGNNGTPQARRWFFGFRYDDAQLVALTVPFLLGLLGYWLASVWILAQETERAESMPTAAQYGLLVKLCGSANIFSAYETMRYLKRGRERRSPAPSSLIVAFTILVLAIVLNHLLSAADLWLHTTASTFIYTSMTKIGVESMPATGTKINVTMCPGPSWSARLSNGTFYYGPCQWTNNERMVAEGLAVIANSSSTSRSVMVDNMAVLVSSIMPDNVDNLTFSSFGIVTYCQPVVGCLAVHTQQWSLYCPSLNPPYNLSTTYFSASGYSSVDALNLTNNAWPSYYGYPLDSVLNPYGARVILYWSLLDDQTIFHADNSPGWYLLGSGGYYGYMGTCNMTAYNVSLSYSTSNGGNGYALASPPVLSNFNTTSALFAALDSRYQANQAEYLHYTLKASSTLSTEMFNTVLSQNMSYAAMGLASPPFERDVSTGGNFIVLRSASRYPLAPLSAVLAILYSYAFLALAITVSSVMLSSREIVVTKSGGKEQRIAAIELVQLRLTNPLASIAERFVDPARPELLLEPSAIDMFHEHPHADKLGVVMAGGYSEGEDGEGIVRRRRTLRVKSVEQSLTSLSGSTINILET